jgi:hypothetical protein
VRRLPSLARRLLVHARSTVARLLPTSLVVYAVGCIVPTPLEQEQPPPNSAPQITAGDPDFLKGPFNPGTHDAEWNFGVTAVDTDVGDELRARLWVLLAARAGGDAGAPATTLVPASDEIRLTATAQSQTVRTGQFFQLPYCVLLSLAPNTPYLFYVYVADVPFPSDNPADLKPGHFDFKSWTVTCP